MISMPRQARLDIPGAPLHIMVRGINKSAIFQDDQDKLQFLERLGKNITAGHCQIYAWVLMRNHFKWGVSTASINRALVRCEQEREKGEGAMHREYRRPLLPNTATLS